MGQPFCQRRYRQKQLDCIYNADEISELQVQQLLADDAALLFHEKELISETRNGRSFRAKAFDRNFFVKEFKPRKWHRRLWERFFPAAHENFHAGARLLQADIPTPVPVLAVVLRQPKHERELLVTGFCEQAEGLDVAVLQEKNSHRAALLDELAAVLAEFHCKGFYSRHLRSANILVNSTGQGWEFWFVDLDRLGTSRLAGSKVFVSTVSRACFEFFAKLKPDERQHLLRTCFDAGLKQNIFRRPSQQAAFIREAAAQIAKRS